MCKKRFWLAVAIILFFALAAGGITHLAAFRSTWENAANGTDANLSVSTVDGTKGWYMAADDAYVYPVSPWTTPEKWKTYISHVDMMKALLIPEDVLKSMSTAGLVETCINYPMYGDYIAFDSYYSRIEMTERNFNGLQELYRRKDAAKEFVRFYQSINVAALHTLHRFPSYQLSFIEFIMANKNIVNKMTSEERVALMKAVIQNTHINEVRGII